MTLWSLKMSSRINHSYRFLSREYIAIIHPRKLRIARISPKAPFPFFEFFFFFFYSPMNSCGRSSIEIIYVYSFANLLTSSNKLDLFLFFFPSFSLLIFYVYRNANVPRFLHVSYEIVNENFHLLIRRKRKHRYILLLR